LDFVSKPSKFQFATNHAKLTSTPFTVRATPKTKLVEDEESIRKSLQYLLKINQGNFLACPLFVVNAVLPTLSSLFPVAPIRAPSHLEM
jgi:hypothetical protein